MTSRDPDRSTRDPNMLEPNISKTAGDVPYISRISRKIYDKILT